MESGLQSEDNTGVQGEEDNTVSSKEHFLAIQFCWAWNDVTQCLQATDKQTQCGWHFDVNKIHEETRRFKPEDNEFAEREILRENQQDIAQESAHNN